MLVTSDLPVVTAYSSHANSYRRYRQKWYLMAAPAGGNNIISVGPQTLNDGVISHSTGVPLSARSPCLSAWLSLPACLPPCDGTTTTLCWPDYYSFVAGKVVPANVWSPYQCTGISVAGETRAEHDRLYKKAYQNEGWGKASRARRDAKEYSLGARISLLDSAAVQSGALLIGACD